MSIGNNRECKYCGRPMRIVERKPDSPVYGRPDTDRAHLITDSVFPVDSFQGMLECPSRICRLINYNGLAGFQIYVKYWVTNDGKVISEGINDTWM
jgi:hypothetical protein